MSLPTYDQTDLALPASGSWPAGVHRFTDEQRLALRAAEAARRPLLVRGDPGTGKSQMAYAAAVATGRLFLSVVVDSRSEASDLMWRFDAVARLSDAHLDGAQEQAGKNHLAVERYVEPGPLWWALDHEGASHHVKAAHVACVPPAEPDGWDSSQGAVLLIDEIDKAEADLPNGLLEALGNWRFNVGPLGRSVSLSAGAKPPLIIVTTNDERELPAPFLRRCLVLTLALPSGQALIDRLVEVGGLHFPHLRDQHPQALQLAAGMLATDRNAAKVAGVYAPGLAEYLDLLRAVIGIGGDPLIQLDKLRRYVFDKQPSI